MGDDEKDKFAVVPTLVKINEQPEITTVGEHMKPKRTASPEARAHMSAGQKRRWEDFRNSALELNGDLLKIRKLPTGVEGDVVHLAVMFDGKFWREIQRISGLIKKTEKKWWQIWRWFE